MNNANAEVRARARLLTSELATPVLAAVALLVLASLLLVMQTSRVAATGYKIRDLQATREHWRRLVYQQEAEVATLQSLGRVEREAKTRFKMIPPPSYVYIIVDQTPGQRAGATPVTYGR